RGQHVRARLEGVGGDGPASPGSCVGGNTPPGSGGAMSQRIGLSTGVELEYVCEGPPEAEAVLFLPGYTDSFASFALNLPALAERHRIYGLSLRGHGNSARPATGYSQAHFVDDVVAFMVADGLPSAAVMGHIVCRLVALNVDYPPNVHTSPA